MGQGEHLPKSPKRGLLGPDREESKVPTEVEVGGRSAVNPETTDRWT